MGPVDPQVDYHQAIQSILCCAYIATIIVIFITLLPFNSGTLILRSRMIEQGWYLSDVACILGLCNIRTFYFASTMDHQDFIRDHSAFSEGICSANQVNEETYETQHVEDGCRCELGRPSAADLRPILESGLIPVLSFRFGHDSAFSGIGVACSEDMPYVAIPMSGPMALGT
jgi:hypothetical protein